MKNLNKISILVLLLITAECFAGGRAGRGTIEDIYQRSYDGLLGVKKMAAIGRTRILAIRAIESL